MWFLQVIVVACVSALAVVLAPVAFRTNAPVPQCDPTSSLVQAPSGHAACVLKNGQVIYLRSVK